MGENHLAAAPTALYGVVLLMAAIAYWILQQPIIAAQGPARCSSGRWRAIGRARYRPSCTCAGIGAAFWSPRLAQGLYLLVALLWLVPDRRIENALAAQRQSAEG